MRLILFARHLKKGSWANLHFMEMESSRAICHSHRRANVCFKSVNFAKSIEWVIQKKSYIYHINHIDERKEDNRRKVLIA